MAPNTENTLQVASAAASTSLKAPSGLMDLSNLAPSMSAVEQRNRKQSPLLCLPSEILSQILTEALGGQYVHVRSEERRSDKVRLCSSPEDCPDSDSPRLHLEYRYATCDDGVDGNSCFTVRHESCADGPPNTKQGLSLDVLRSCREIYRQGVLLPFQENEFVFGLHAAHTEDEDDEGMGSRHAPAPEMGGFINSLRREQRDAMRHVTIASGSEFKCSQQLGRLTGLRSLHMLIAPGTDPVDLYYALEECWTSADAYPLNSLPLREFRITAEVYLTDRWEFAGLLRQAPELDALIRHLEAWILRCGSQNVGGKIHVVEDKDPALPEDHAALIRYLGELDEKRFEDVE